MGIKSWDDLWIIEGMSSLYETHFMSLLFPDRIKTFNDHFAQFTSDTAHLYDFTNDEDDELWSLNHHVEITDEIILKFDFITYKKAAAVLKTFQEAMGEKTWMKGLRYFLKKMQFQSADASDLHSALQKAYDEDHPNSGIDLAQYMETWENQPGFPVVTVKKENGKVIFTQERFIKGNGEIYAIPISFATAKNPNFEDKTAALWMTTKQLEIDYDDDWIIANIQNSGYYYVNYDDKLWNDITSQLLRNHSTIHYLNRIHLTLNHYWLARKGLANKANLLKMFDYMKFERDLTVWNEADLILRRLNEAFSPFWFHEDYEKYVRNIVEINYYANGYNSESVVSDWACKCGLQACQSNAIAELILLKNQTKDNGTNQKVFCNGIRADKQLFRTFWELLLKSTDDLFRSKILSSLACSNDQELLLEYLQSSINETFNYSNSERVDIITASIDNPKSLQIAYDFLKDNYKTVHHL